MLWNFQPYFACHRLDDLLDNLGAFRMLQVTDPHTIQIDLTTYPAQSKEPAGQITKRFKVE
jgi:hypothetical protein